MAEIKYSQQNIGFYIVDLNKGIFKITNRFYFTDLNDYEIIYIVKANEKVLKEINLSNINQLSSLKPQESIIIDLHSEIDSLKPLINTEYFINFQVILKSDINRFIPKGYKVAHDQFRLPIEPLPKTIIKEIGPKLSISNTSEEVVISSSKVEFIFNKAEKIVKYRSVWLNETERRIFHNGFYSECNCYFTKFG